MKHCLLSLTKGKSNLEKTVYFEVEIKKREFFSRLVLAAILADKGCHALIGPRVNLKVLKKILNGGTIVRKSISPNEKGLINELVSSGFGCVAMDEEGLLVDSLERFAKLRHSEHTVSLVDKIFLWGGRQKDYLASNFTEHSHKFKVIGNPRVALWQEQYFGYYDDKVKSIKNKYGDYVLIVSNFAVFTNSKLCDRMLSEAGYFDSKENIKSHFEHSRRVEFLFHQFVSAAKQIASSGRKVIFRPHPSDNVKYLRSVFCDDENVVIEGNGEASPWILGAKALIHNCCTTAVEAALMGCRVVSYCPDNVSQYDLDSVNNLGIKVYCEGELLKAIDQSVDVDVDVDFTLDGFLRLDCSFDEMVLEFLDNAKCSNFDTRFQALHRFAYPMYLGPKNLARHIKDLFIMNGARRVERSTFRGKFPPTYPGEINRFLGVLQKSGLVSRAYHAVPVAENTFYIKEKV